MQTKLITELLSSAQAHVPALGFTINAIKAGAQQSGLATTSTVSELFPNQTSTAQSLLQRYDELYWEGTKMTQQDRGLRGEGEQSKAFEEAVEMIERKLLFSAAVKSKLPDVSSVNRYMKVDSSTCNRHLALSSPQLHLLFYQSPYPIRDPSYTELIQLPMKHYIWLAGQATYQ